MTLAEWRDLNALTPALPPQPAPLPAGCAWLETPERDLPAGLAWWKP